MSRGYRPPEPAAAPGGAGHPGGATRPSPVEPAAGGPDHVRRPAESEAAAAFVCEDDVRVAIRAGRKVMIGDKTIITPAARDLGEENKVFIQAGWPR